MNSMKTLQLSELKEMLKSLLEDTNNQKYLYVSLAIGAIKALEKIPENDWEKDCQYTPSSPMLVKILEGFENNKWEIGYELNSANVRVDALRDRVAYYYDEVFKINRPLVSAKKDCKGVFTKIPEVLKVYEDVRSFKHLEYEEYDRGKEPLSKVRQSTPSNTASALKKLLKLLADKNFYEKIKRELHNE